MSMNVDSQQFESFVPVYDVVPEKWEDARAFLVETLKKITNALNSNTRGFLLDEELLSGQSFIPSAITPPGDNPGLMRQVLRKVIIIGPIVAGAVSKPHGITVDTNFTLIDLRATATNTGTLTSTIFGNSDTINIIGPNINITSNGTYDLCFAFIEYCQEK